MIDIFMALWNTGFVVKVIKALSAFLLICISISLLLVTVGAPGVARWSFLQFEERHTGNMGSASNLTATALVGYARRIRNTPTATHAVPVALSCPTVPARVPRPPRSRNTLGRRGKPPTSRTPTTAVSPTATSAPTNTPPPATEPATPTPTPPASITLPTNGAPPPPAPTNTPPATPSKKSHPISFKDARMPQQVKIMAPRDTEGIERSASLNSFNSALAENQAPVNCLNDSLLDSVYSQDLAVLERNLGVIVCGSLLGTLLFYAFVFLLKRMQAR